MKLIRILKILFPKWQANRRYRETFKRDINWNHPTEFNEKLRWLQFNTDTHKWSLLADKYKVRSYLKENGYGRLLTKLYGVWKNANEINFATLPKSFVLKTNHGCGSVYIITDKTKINEDLIKKQLNHDLKERFGIETAEPHYLSIKPVIIAEELIEQDGNYSTSLVDYKLYCIKGEPIFCGVIYNRDISNRTYDYILLDMDWNVINESHHSQILINERNCGIPKPKTLNQMIDFCRNMCVEFPFVRMDFYESNGRLYFGEFTFTPAACTGGSLGLNASEILGENILIE